MEEILCFTTNVSSIGPCIQLQNKTIGDFHGNLTYGTMLGMELHISQRIPQANHLTLHLAFGDLPHTMLTI